VAATRFYAGGCHNHPNVRAPQAVQLLQKELTGHD
jgi:hypothetical protein